MENPLKDISGAKTVVGVLDGEFGSKVRRNRTRAASAMERWKETFGGNGGSNDFPHTHQIGFKHGRRGDGGLDSHSHSRYPPTICLCSGLPRLSKLGGPQIDCRVTTAFGRR